MIRVHPRNPRSPFRSGGASGIGTTTGAGSERGGSGPGGVVAPAD
jgi:hypothetical protein